MKAWGGAKRDLSTTFFDPVFLQQRGGLREDNALEYFSRSPFWSRKEGIEFVLAEVVPHPSGPTLVIQQQRRLSARQTELQAVFYIMQGTVYQCPSLHDVVRSRLDKCGVYLNEAFDELKAFCDEKQKARARAEARNRPVDLAEDLFLPNGLRKSAYGLKIGYHHGVPLEPGSDDRLARTIEDLFGGTHLQNPAPVAAPAAAPAAAPPETTETTAETSS